MSREEEERVVKLGPSKSRSKARKRGTLLLSHSRDRERKGFEWRV